MTFAQTLPTPGIAATLADRLPAVRYRDPALVVGFAGLTALAAQVSIPLGFTPVPLTGQTFAVLLTGGLLGAKRGAAAMALYVALGAIGFPFYSAGGGGWQVATGSTMGYLVGFVLAAALVGALAERQADRRVGSALMAFAAGSALSLGVTPFLGGDLMKIALAGVALPMGWRLLGDEAR